MALVIRDTSVVPPERWIFPGINGYVVSAPNYAALFGEIERHYTANNQPVPDRQTIIDWICANLHVPCYEDETREPLVNKFALGTPLPPTACCGGAKP